MITKPKLIGVKPAEVTTDQRAQRALDQNRVRDIAARLSQEALGIPAVSRRADGTQVWIDGQTRGNALVAAGQGNRVITCQVYEGLTLAEEAQLFRKLNDSKAITSADQFRIAVTEGDQIAVAAEKALTLAGWSMHQGRVNTMKALNTLYVCWERDSTATVRALTTLAMAWGPTPVSGSMVLVKGMWMFAYRYGAPEMAVSWDKLSGYLAQQRGGAKMFLAEARANAETRRINKPDAVADMVTNTWNRKTRSEARKLPDWSTRGA